jgi:hypothetical protein
MTFSLAATALGAFERKRLLKKLFPSRPTNPARMTDGDFLPEHLPVASEVMGHV